MPTKTTLTDRAILQNIYYGKSKDLETRLCVWDKYGSNKVPLVDWITSQLLEVARGAETLLDAGCGTGRLLYTLHQCFQHLHLHGIDISLAMAQRTRSQLSATKQSNIQQGDIESLPYARNTFDIVTATHVLHHVFNIRRAIKELRLVTKPKGILFISTSDYRLDRGLNRLHYEALQELSFPLFMRNKHTYLRFTPTYAATLLGQYFKAVKTAHYISNAIFPDVDPCMEYYRSAMMFRQTQGLTDERITSKQWETLLHLMENKVRQVITRKGRLVQPGKVVVFKAFKL